MKEKYFCENCREDVSITVTDKQLEGKVKKKKYTYNGKVAHCSECGTEIYTGEINDYNLESLFNKIHDEEAAKQKRKKKKENEEKE